MKGYKIIAVLIISLLLLATVGRAQQKKWTLAQCIDRALSENITLKESKVNNAINHINYLQSKSAVYPNLNFSAGQTINNQNTYNVSSGSYSPNTVFSNSFNLNSAITLYNNFKLTNQIKQNKLNVDAGELDVQKQSNDLLLSVIAAYMQVLSDYEAVDISKAQVGITEDHVAYTQKYVNAGSLPESNLLQMQAQLATDNSALTDAQNQLNLAKLALVQLMEMPFTKDFELQRPDTVWHDPMIVYNAEYIYSRSLDIMPEVKSASFKSEAAHLGFKIAQSELMPKLSLGASMNTAYNSANTLTGYQTTTTQGQIGYLQSNPSEAVIGNITRSTPYNYNYPFSNQLSDNFISGISLNLSVPIYNNRQFKSDVERADVNEKYALLNESLVKNQLRKTIETAYADMLAASKTYASAKSQLFSEERSYHDIELKFRFGAINTTDLFVEKNNLVKARLAFSQAKFQYMFKAKLVAFYLGEKITD